MKNFKELHRQKLLEERRVKRIMRLFEETVASNGSEFNLDTQPGTDAHKEMRKKAHRDSVHRGDFTSSTSFSFDPRKLRGSLTAKVKRALDRLEDLMDPSNENKNTMVEDVVNLLNGDLKSEEGRWALQQGTDNDKFAGVENGGTKLIGNGSPSQSNIFISKSIAYAMCSAPTALDQIKNKSHTRPWLKINVMTTDGDKYVILDGHHRWSQQFTFGSPTETEIDTRAFNFEGMGMEETLSKLQIGIAANTEATKDVPSWFHDEAGNDTRTPRSEDVNQTSTGSSDNLLGASKQAIIAKIHDLLNKVGKDEIDKGIAHAANNTRFMGDDWIAELAADSAFASWIGDNSALQSYKRSPVNFDDKPGNQLIRDGKIICPLREAIAIQCADALASTVCAKSIASSAPDRDHMPQLDHKAALGEDGEKRLLNQLKQGKINHNKAITGDAQKAAEAAISESVIDRWNKLAGLLKD